MVEYKVLNTKSLREQVYDYLKNEINEGRLKRGDFIDVNKLSVMLGISKTPLRDALLQLEIDGFVKILPRRGIVVNDLTLDDIKNYYEMIGGLESSALLSVADKMLSEDFDKMEKLNDEMKQALDQDDFDLYYEKNVEFHNVYLNKSCNKPLLRTLEVCKQRLYDFPRKKDYVPDWEYSSLNEHAKIVEFLRMGEFVKAADYIRDVHWSFEVQKKYILQYYFNEMTDD
ncbi:GntR family transcriptional regulator [Deferribacter autotrophicus]|uniref:GntR family transcriptional regulator n=1 Tax=Deferribacter autotrophicus TaxID=500465 RepID=A0A5A8F3Q5_9BACT|nr:GntR family transcriptional regulator [Deferribacter autotrophicus]KAA0258834.1 GntR family transcriptional regulator [Deferribacter autotrophicus]